MFSNLTTKKRGQELFCSHDTNLLQRLLTFVHHPDSIIRRGGAIGIFIEIRQKFNRNTIIFLCTGLLKNISFDTSRHEWLLGPDVDILPVLLLPLAGPEEFTDAENDTFPIELQYLDSDKKREPDPDCRKMLLETLHQLCATKSAREYLRSHGAYEILRELHKFELTENGDKLALIECENVVDILIR